MARVTVDDVEEIFDNSDSIPLGAFITGANLIVTKNLSGTILVSDELVEIERWLSAHMAAMRIRQEDSIKVSSAQAKFTGKYGMRLSSTQYGQMVLVLDRTGILASLGQPAAQFAVISKGELP